MTKTEFMCNLKKKLGGLPEKDKTERLAFYSELIDDRIEDGIAEETAVADLGSIDELAAQITSEMPISNNIKDETKQQRTLKWWEITLIVLGFPLWFSFISVAFAVIISLYAALFSVVVAIYSADIAIVGGAIIGAFESLLFFIAGNAVGGIFFVGAAIALGALSWLMWFGCNIVTKWIFEETKRLIVWIKTLFVKKEA